MAGGQECCFCLDLSCKESFKDPSKWWDDRNSKRNSRPPDFQPKVTKEALCMDSSRDSSRVKGGHHISQGFAVPTAKAESDADAIPCSLIWQCSKNRDLSRGAKLHQELRRRGLAENDYSNALITMYAKCGKLEKAQALLDMHKSSSSIPWNALIAGYVRQGQCQKALDCFDQMQRKHVVPTAVTYTCILKAYAATGALLQAQDVLHKCPFHNVFIWTALIAGYAQNGQEQQALHCFEQMQADGIPPDAVAYACVLKACASIGAINKGKQLHNEIMRQGLLFEDDVVLGNALVDMYAKCGALPQAQDVLDKLPSRNVIIWTALIAGYAQNGQEQQALHCFEQMEADGISPDAVTYACILKACASIGAINKGKQFHDEIMRQGLLFEDDVVLGNALVDMYAKCGALPQAQDVLDKLPSRDVVTWNALITGYTQNGEGQQALHCFEQMQVDGIPPDAVTYTCILEACASIGAINKGKQFHNEITRQGLLLEDNVVLGAALVDMYAKCGALPQAQDVLEKLPSRDVVTWSALLAGYAQNGQGQQALNCFEQMQADGIPPNAVTYACILKACASMGAINKGRQLHDEITRQGLLLEDNVALGAALVDMYAKCGALPQAQGVLEKLHSHDVVTWNALIAGYVQEGQEKEVFKCYEMMQDEGILPDVATFLCLLNLCSHLGLLERGQQLFDSMEAVYGLKPSLECFTCMVDLLGRAGHLGKAVEMVRDTYFDAECSMWHALLGACWKWVDVNVGSWAFEQVLETDKSDSASYVLMANIFAAAGMKEKTKDVEAMRIKNKARKLPGCSSWTDANNIVHEFHVCDISHEIVVSSF